MEEAELAIKHADEQMGLATQLDDIPAAAEAQRNATYHLLRQLVIDTARIRVAMENRPT